MSPNGRLLLIVLATVAGMTLWLTYNHVFPDDYDLDLTSTSTKTRDSDPQTSSLVGPAVSYDKTTPPGTGCEEVVSSLQRLLIEGYTPLFEGIRHVNVWGYLETPNKGDAAIWVAQQMFLSTMGIETMEACRFATGVSESHLCDMGKYRAALEEHRPHSGIVMAGGGNFNDFYWTDQPQRIEIVNRFPDYPIRMFPQSIYMTKPDRIKATTDSFEQHPDLQLGARDKPSFDWLQKTFGGRAQDTIDPSFDAPAGYANGEGKGVVRTTLTPDIVFMYGNRPDYRNQPKQYDIYILARVDAESSTLGADSPSEETGTITLSDGITVTYLKKDWNDMPTPALNDRVTGKNQRAYMKANEGFNILGRAEFVITDRLHGHIMSTVAGIPHVLMDSKLGKNLALHNTWTATCDCTRIAESWAESLEYARMWFEKAYAERRWRPAA